MPQSPQGHLEYELNKLTQMNVRWASIKIAIINCCEEIHRNFGPREDVDSRFLILHVLALASFI